MSVLSAALAFGAGLFMRVPGVGLLFFLASLLLVLNGCATSPLPVISTGLDAARAGIKSACPNRTDTCEHIVTTFNAAENAYNLAVIAEAVSKDSSALANSALGYLEAVLTALENIGAPNELAGNTPH
jgi:hypothetical protein